MYKAPHNRRRNAQYYRENKNLVKAHQSKFKDMNGPNIRRKRRPQREAVSGFKMSYRYKYYQSDLVEEEDMEESE